MASNRSAQRRHGDAVDASLLTLDVTNTSGAPATLSYRVDVLIPGFDNDVVG